MHLDKVLTVAQVAALAGWQRRRMLRHLLRMNEQLGGMLLKNVGSKRVPRWTVTLANLQRVAPQWFVDAESVEARLRDLEEARDEQRRIIALQNERIRDLTNEVVRLRAKAA